jgi:UDP-glucose 4-epimerase
MNVLVSGGAGYIGSVVTDALLQAGHVVTVFDSLVKGYRAAVPAGATFVQGDIHDRSALDRLMDATQFDAVLHFAAFIEAGESMVDPGRYFGNNTAGSFNLIDAAASHGVGRFVLSSTAAVYASKDTPIRETDPIAPANVYGASKLMVEQALAWYHRVKGLRFAALRYFNACGATPGRGEAHSPETHLIPLILQVPLGQRRAVGIFGADYPTPDGTCVRDYVHVLDLASAHLLALDALAQHETLICNLGNGNGFSVREVIETARRVTGQPIAVQESPRRPGDAPTLVADAGLARRVLGWQPRITDLGEIIESAWEWHRTHPRGYQE